MKSIDMTMLSGGGLSSTLSQQGFTTNVKQYNAFTLAEVLITLGVIGVVASLTLPLVINNTQDKVLETEYAKSKSILANGYKKMMADSQVYEVKDLPMFNSCKDEACITNEHKKAFNINVDTTLGLKPETMPEDYIIQGKEDKSQFKWEDVPYMFSTPDGMTYGLLPDDTTMASFAIVADVNGGKNPNTVRKDLYKFRFSGSGVLSDVTSDLEYISTCSVDDPAGCKTAEECNSLRGQADSQGRCPNSVYWNGQSCQVYNMQTFYCR